jgi:hypothetical protein
MEPKEYFKKYPYKNLGDYYLWKAQQPGEPSENKRSNFDDKEKYEFDHLENYGGVKTKKIKRKITNETQNSSNQPPVQIDLFNDFLKIFVFLVVIYAIYNAYQSNPGKVEFVNAAITKIFEDEINKMDDNNIYKNAILNGVKENLNKENEFSNYIASAYDKEIERANFLIFSLFSVNYEDDSGSIHAFAFGIFGDVYILNFSLNQNDQNK